jgi:hypothetical protein
MQSLHTGGPAMTRMPHLGRVPSRASRQKRVASREDSSLVHFWHVGCSKDGPEDRRGLRRCLAFGSPSFARLPPVPSLLRWLFRFLTWTWLVGSGSSPRSPLNWTEGRCVLQSAWNSEYHPHQDPLRGLRSALTHRSSRYVAFVTTFWRCGQPSAHWFSRRASSV